RPFDGGSRLARPCAIAAHRGKLYVPLNNLMLDTVNFFLVPGGPRLLARIDPNGDGGVDAIDLGPTCLNPIWVQSDGTRLFVSCQGAVTYNASFVATAVKSAGLVMLV